MYLCTVCDVSSDPIVRSKLYSVSCLVCQVIAHMHTHTHTRAHTHTHTHTVYNSDKFTILTFTFLHSCHFHAPYAHRFGGYCPQVKFATGETYGKATRNFFDFTRLESLNTSVMPHTHRNSYGGEGTIHNLAPVATPRSRPGDSHFILCIVPGGHDE